VDTLTQAAREECLPTVTLRFRQVCWLSPADVHVLERRQFALAQYEAEHAGAFEVDARSHELPNANLTWRPI